MYCRKCGTLLPDDAAFCVKCGQAVKKSETVCADTSMMSHESGGGKQINKSKTKMFLVAVIAFFFGSCNRRNCVFVNKVCRSRMQQ